MFSDQIKKEKMQLALAEARKAQALGEVPIGAVVVDSGGNVIGRGYNRREIDKNATAHAEMIAIRQACHKKHSWRLTDCSLFVTLEPCPMCAGAVINCRMKNVLFGALDPKAGAAGSVINLFAVPKFNHHPLVIRGLFREEASSMLKDFFKGIRKRQAKEKTRYSSQNKKNKLS